MSRHLSKLFDSLAKLKFKMSPDKKPLKTALGMFSKEEEFVPLSAECDLSGQVSGAGSCCTWGGGCGAWAEKKPRTEQWSHGECQSTEPCSPSGGPSAHPPFVLHKLQFALSDGAFMQPFIKWGEQC